MPEFILSKVSDYGTSHPIVARTSYQATRLVQLFGLSKEKTDEIFTTARDVQRRLLTCWEIQHELERKLIDAAGDAERSGLRDKAAARVVEAPAVAGLDVQCEQFLYSAKLALRDIAGLFRIFFGEPFDENYKKFEEWAKVELGPDHQITRLVESDRRWIARIIAMRNGVEHPTHKGGPLRVSNLTVEAVGDELFLRRPTWAVGEYPPTDVVEEMREAIDAMLAFFEELLLACLLNQPLLPGIQPILSEIPEAQRDPGAPLRFDLKLSIVRPPDA